MAEKTRYSDEELAEFKQLILDKLDKAQKDFDLLKSAITQSESNDTQDTSPTFKVLEEGAATLSKEESGKLAQRPIISFFLDWHGVILLYISDKIELQMHFLQLYHAYDPYDVAQRLKAIAMHALHLPKQEKTA